MICNVSDFHTIVFDFDGVFTDNKVYIDQSGNESIRCDRGDGLGVDMLRKHIAIHNLGIRMKIVSKEKNNVVLSRAKKMKIPCENSCDNKFFYLSNYFKASLSACKEPFNGLIYLGNDLNDLEVMRVAGFSVAPSDAHKSIKAIANIVLPELGGSGFVRSFVENVLGVTYKV
ncbi:MAG: HAD hydrolase family protein [Coxiellaceae bacterium]|nr:HAD hydrolase family protein [Coxiellaceae bacterium]MDF1865539.1 HAD hydrolase family protein [Saprospiraceae bacterium]